MQRLFRWVKNGMIVSLAVMALLTPLPLKAQSPQNIPRRPDLQVPGQNRNSREQNSIINGGVTYNTGAFQIHNSTVLDTEMTVYPRGLALPPHWIYVTATNRADKSVEVVGAYYSNTPGLLSIFDWSCSLNDPCPNADGTVSTEPSWRFNIQFADLGCNMTVATNGGGHLKNTIRYQNETVALDAGTPPLWQNNVYLWNYCKKTWDEPIYSHAYRVTPQDCSLPSSTCGWWGPIIETFFANPQPRLKEIGFHNTSLSIDGSRPTFLSAATTTWSRPSLPWSTYHLLPNYSWSVGSPTLGH